MYEHYNYEWILRSPKTKGERIAQLRQLNAKGKLSRRCCIQAIRLIMEYGITEKYATQLFEGKVVL